VPKAIIFCDIDGCLNDGKHIGFDLDALAEVRQRIRALNDRGVILSLCTGRPQPYAEAMAQVLDLHTPIVCEHGAMVFDPKTEQVFPMLAPHGQQEIAALRRHLKTIVGVENNHTFEPGNEFGLCITGPGIIGCSYDEIRMIKDEYLAKCPGFDINWAFSNCAIDISPKGIGKQSGAAWVLDRLGIKQSATYAIGDSAGDLGVLSFVNHSLCPANAAQKVRDICDFTAKESTTRGVVEILDHILSKLA